MFLKQNICDILAASANTPLTLVYGSIKSLISQTVDWSELLISDDSGEITVWIPNSMIQISTSLIEECILIVNRSGKSVITANNGKTVLLVNAAEDIVLRKEAYNLMRSLTGRDSNVDAGTAALASTNNMLEVAADQTAIAAVAEPAASAPATVTPALPAAPVVLTPQAPTAAAKLSKPYSTISAQYLDCLEASTVANAEYVKRHPEMHAMLNAEIIQKVAVTFFIESNKRQY